MNRIAILNTFYTSAKSRALLPVHPVLLEDGRLSIDPAHTLDIRTARRSVRQFLDLDIKRLVCYHGGILDSRIRESIQETLEE
jgi:hypothetical protein